MFKKREEFSCDILGVAFHERLFEQDLVTRLKVPWLTRFLFATLPRQSTSLGPFIVSLSRVSNFRRTFVLFSTRLFSGNYYRGGHFKALPLHTVTASDFDRVAWNPQQFHGTSNLCASSANPDISLMARYEHGENAKIKAEIR